MCSGDLQDGALRSLEAGPLHVWRRLPVRSRRPRAPGSLPPGQVRRTCQEPTRLPCFGSEASPHLSRRRYKTIVCQNFASGKCPYGRRCNCQAIAACDDLCHLQLQNVAGATSSTSCRRRPSAPLQRAFQALSSCSTLSCSALSSSDQRRPRPRSFSTRTSTRRCRPSSRRSVEPRRRCRRAPCRRCRR